MEAKKDCCGDAGCIIQPEVGGMVTSGGCRCRQHQLTREILLLRKENARLEKDLQDFRDDCQI